MVSIRSIDEPNSPWIAEVVSDEDTEEKILIGYNGKLVLEHSGWLVELWPGFAGERDFDIEEYVNVEEEDE